MTVTAKAPNGPNTSLSVTRGANGTTATTHLVNAAVLQVVPATSVSVTNMGGVEVAVNDVIKIDSEQMQVTAVSGGPGPWTLTVTRGYNGTTEAAHSSGTTVSKMVPETTIPDANNGGVEVAVNDVIKVDSEQMRVTAVSGGPGPWTLTVTRGYNGTTEAAHSSGATVSKIVQDTTIQVTNTGPTSAVAVNDVIQVGSEQMQVNAVSTGPGPWTLSVTRGFNGTTEAAHSSGAAVSDVVPDTTFQVTQVAGGPVEVAVGDVLQIDSEQMLVTSVTAGAANIWTLTVARGYNGTMEAAHSATARPSRRSLRIRRSTSPGRLST